MCPVFCRKARLNPGNVDENLNPKIKFPQLSQGGEDSILLTASTAASTQNQQPLAHYSLIRYLSQLPKRPAEYHESCRLQ